MGNTTTCNCYRPLRAVHPHGCGEHGFRPVHLPDEFGSSPRVWGTRGLGRIAGPGARFIPTGVGNTVVRCRSDLRLSVHPHGCGEHPSAKQSSGVISGSSPRVWGTHLGSMEIRVRTRFIPTGVGNTRLAEIRGEQSAVHPHGCGEHISRRNLRIIAPGSSPRVWGTRWRWDTSYLKCRFIPTGVGNTFSYTDARRDLSVHPHGCGEHVSVAPNHKPDHGSSPRVWGTPAWWRQESFQKRFIPTGVGNTSLNSPGCPRERVHPHGCGEHFIW